ncbi:hypothetical protein C2G38_2140845 [Gigaspora rosea]|uniref:Uncharacterized protein n=1 Tax=Gigaspora rosea TaxID=44941 RepID=A0A397VH02_9GLOM|nr:hypothetical protein C2G38_2140845 [Gigaspora rosea]
MRVAKKEGWNVAAGIRDPLDDDPMEVFFQERLARQSARNNRPRKNGKLKCQVCSFQMGPEKWEVWHQTRWRIGPCWVTNFLAAWPTRFCSREIPTYGSMLPYPSTYQHRFGTAYTEVPQSRSACIKKKKSLKVLLKFLG